MKKKVEHSQGSLIATNKTVQREYFIEQRIEAGLQLQGWEIKSIRAGRVQMKESYVLIKDNEAWLFGSHISPLLSASTHIHPDPTRTRKLLLHRVEIDKLRGAVERKGYAIVPTMLYWKKGHVKCEIALGKGKKLHDVRATEKDREWKREQERLFKTH